MPLLPVQWTAHKSVLIRLALAALCLLQPNIYGQQQPDLSNLDLPTLQQRAQSGDAMAETELGTRFLRGQGGVFKDFAAALEWFTKAAAQNVPKAENGLGLIYSNGFGVQKDPAQALSWFNKAAAQNYPGAEANLGQMYADGDGVERSYAQAMFWYQKAADQGNAAAQNSIGNLYLYGQGVPKDYAQAISWYQKAADQGISPAEYNLGRIYEHGWGTTQDYAQSLIWYHKAADQGNAGAQTGLGGLYKFGHGVTQDYEQALLWYRKAADQGYAPAQLEIGILYEVGHGVPRSYSEAADWYRKAADKGNTNAQVNLGAIYEYARGVDRDYSQAADWYRKAAENGSALGQYYLGLLYEEGHGVTQDYTLAADWYRKAAEQGNANSQVNLGALYARGQGVTKDEIQAVDWYRKAAEQGDAEAQLKLGRLSEWGEGVPKDHDQARMWIQKAADQGNAEAKTDLPRYIGPVRHPGVAEDYTTFPNQIFPMLVSLSKDLQNSYKACIVLPKDLNDGTRAKAIAACNTMAAYYTGDIHDTAAALIAYQQACALGDAKNCQTLGLTLNKKGDLANARTVWTDSPACQNNTDCRRLLFFSYFNPGNNASPDRAGMERYGRPLCETSLQMDICQMMTKDGLNVDMAAIAQRKRQLQIDDLKNRINGLEQDAQSNDTEAAMFEGQASLANNAISAAIANHGAQSDRNSSANDRAQAQQLRNQLIALQGDSGGAEARDESLISRIGGVVQDIHSIVAQDTPPSGSGGGGISSAGSPTAKLAACQAGAYSQHMRLCQGDPAPHQASCYLAASDLCQCYVDAYQGTGNPDIPQWEACAANNKELARKLLSAAPTVAQ